MNNLYKIIRKLRNDYRSKLNQYAIIVRISKQKLYLVKGNKIINQYSVSTSKYGVGNKDRSNQTPLGMHRICSKICKKVEIGTIFQNRRNTKRLSKIYNKWTFISKDEITTRIFRLEGLESGINKGKGIDSFRRQIYIHGTPVEYLIGKPASNCCVRMRNKDVIELFNCVPRNTLVEIIA